jgi:hypothetical protein
MMGVESNSDSDDESQVGGGSDDVVRLDVSCWNSAIARDRAKF